MYFYSSVPLPPSLWKKQKKKTEKNWRNIEKKGIIKSKKKQMTRRKNIYMETRVIVKFVGTKADVKLAFRMDSYVGGKQNNVSTLGARR